MHCRSDDGETSAGGAGRKTNEDVTGKTCIVTGANSGDGKGATRRDRGPAKQPGETARQEILKEVQNTKLMPLLADLSSQSDARALVKEIERAYPQLDVLIDNAGLKVTERSKTPTASRPRW